MSTIYTAVALRDAHRRTHQGAETLLQHCADFTAEELAQQHSSFGGASLLEMWQHIIGAEDYWLNVLCGEWDVTDRADTCKTIEELETMRAMLGEQTASYLGTVSDEALNAPTELATWPEGRVRTLLPACIVMRIITHNFHHRGQVCSICRILGRPVEHGMDFPLAP